MAKHTPGPWVYFAKLSGSENHKGFNLAAEYGKWLGDLTPMNNEDGDPSEEAIANARLIAAAPELVEALERFCQIASGEPFDLTDSPKSLVTRINENRNDARALLRKIKGE